MTRVVQVLQSVIAVVAIGLGAFGIVSGWLPLAGRGHKASIEGLAAYVASVLLMVVGVALLRTIWSRSATEELDDIS